MWPCARGRRLLCLSRCTRLAASSSIASSMASGSAPHRSHEPLVLLGLRTSVAWSVSNDAHRRRSSRACTACPRRLVLATRASEARAAAAAAAAATTTTTTTPRRRGSAGRSAAPAPAARAAHLIGRGLVQPALVREILELVCPCAHDPQHRRARAFPPRPAAGSKANRESEPKACASKARIRLWRQMHRNARLAVRAHRRGVSWRRRRARQRLPRDRFLSEDEVARLISLARPRIFARRAGGGSAALALSASASPGRRGSRRAWKTARAAMARGCSTARSPRRRRTVRSERCSASSAGGYEPGGKYSGTATPQ